jgi:hypothetical protein
MALDLTQADVDEMLAMRERLSTRYREQLVRLLRGER